MLARIARPLQSLVRDPARGLRLLSSETKLTTGFVGLDVVPNAREVLIGLYGKTLSELQSIPATAQYRINVEKITNHRMGVCQSVEDPHTIETTILQGQLEELIASAERELELIPKMKEWAPWDVPSEHVIEYELDVDTYEEQMPTPPEEPAEEKK
eukprot:CAMPEP_0118937638 /NCGR_PEP_ID=MMETSP1169-20130426/23350_1 /TAXON_ID=36882 /ORGANISM="Pyramimonas obovata, Strain CCMP722" /LENGTH=155 /DNA_ID=CAMNT_0006881333 /DNA_START=38 /DNA_END=505 /DNA_ORIENTATION=+